MIGEIADKYDTHWGAIKAYLGVHHLDGRKPPKHLEDEMAYRDKEVLEVLYVEAGMTQEEIAERLDASQPSVSRWLRRHGLKEWGSLQRG